jgi:Holliday junction DNA helicase RuvB
MDNKILNTIIDKFKGGPCRFVHTGYRRSSSETIEEVYEPFLFKRDSLCAPRGREVTDKATSI